MALHFKNKEQYQKRKVVGQLRRTQLVTTFGSGSIVDMPDYSVIIAATNYWKDGPVLHEENLQKLLKVSHFKQPFVSDDPDTEYTPDIPAFRFPELPFMGLTIGIVWVDLYRKIIFSIQDFDQ